MEELHRLRVSQPQDAPLTTRAFTPLLDVPVDVHYASAPTVRSRPSPVLPNWLLAESSSTTTTIPRMQENGSVQPSRCDREKGRTNTERGRLTFRSGRKDKIKEESEREEEEDEEEGPVFTVGNAPRYRRPPLSQVFGAQVSSDSDSLAPSVGQVEDIQLNGQEPNGSAASELDYELKTVCLSKTKQSLGEKLFAPLSHPLVTTDVWISKGGIG